MSKYNSSSIEVIENLEAVRKRPGMYIGDTNSKGLHHLFREILNNSVDEHLAGFCDKIIVTLHSNNSITVEDNGRGIPVDIHSKTKKSGVETVFTKLHSGGKFGGKNSSYKIAGGLHGVGSSVVNALSEFVEITIWKDKQEHFISFKDGGNLNEELKNIGKTNRTGTKVKFRPDIEIFSSINFNDKKIIEILKEIAFLNNELKIKFIDDKNKKTEEFYYVNGLIDFINDKTENKKEVTKANILESQNEEIKIKASFKYTTESFDNFFSYVNNIFTPEGGTHENAFKTALTKSIKEFALENKLQQGNSILEGKDIREGLSVVISVSLIEKYLQFEGQTKNKLSVPILKSHFEKVFYEEINHYLFKNKKEGLEIVKRAYISKKLREKAKIARDLSKELKENSKKNFSGKLVPAQNRKPEDKELFIVEGDSAGGSAKLGRDRKSQAILPLKGKIINTEKANMKSILQNEELSSIIYSVGGNIGSKFDKSKVNYGKVIIMTDADTDGAHIQSLLLTFFYRFMRGLVDDGMVYIALPPLFKITIKRGKKVIYAWSDEELKKIKSQNANIEIQRYKGLGEMNHDQLWETTMNPEKRNLIKVNVQDEYSVDKIVETLMGQNVEIRRKWLEENIEFSLEDNYLE